MELVFYAALVQSHAPRTRSSTSPLTMANARRKVDSSAGPRAAPSTARTSGPASEAHCPIAANDLDPAITAAIPTASRPDSACRRASIHDFAVSLGAARVCAQYVSKTLRVPPADLRSIGSAIASP